MKPAKNRTIMHGDLDSFYASVEQRDNPRLRGRPVLVGAGIVLAASYEAKAYGVRTPMTGREAMRLCPDAITVPPRMAAYSEASRAVFDIFRDTSPEVEGLSIDEAFLDVTGLARLVGDGQAIAATLQRRVRDEVGLALSIGVATTKFLAKVASAVSKPNGLLVIEPGKELEFLHPLPVRRLWGVGPVTAAKLNGRGLDTVADVAALDRRNSSRSSVRVGAVICTPWLTTTTPDRSTPADGAARSAPSGPSPAAHLGATKPKSSCSRSSNG